MNIFETYAAHIEEALKQLCTTYTKPLVEYPRNGGDWDLTTNTAMVNAKNAGIPPRELAEKILKIVKLNGEVAGPGFINFNIDKYQWIQEIDNVLQQEQSYGKNKSGIGKSVNVEYVSANPTGPLHIGHLRGAVYGDVLASILEASGYDVTREYYVNDAGSQVEKLALSVKARWNQVNGNDFNDEDLHYPGEYVFEAAKNIKTIPEDWEEFKSICVSEMMSFIVRDLASINIEFDVFSYESDIIKNVDGLVETLKEKELVYKGIPPKPKAEKAKDWEPREQLLFKSTDFGDDEDRAFQKADGDWTYFATDIAYHTDKAERCFNELVNIWGADHGGYAPRIKAATKAITDKDLTVVLAQMVSLIKNGEPVRMGKRLGNFITIEELLKEIPVGVIRFYMAMRSPDTQMSFDLDEATKQSKDNPYWYVQYAHTRISSVMDIFHEKYPNEDWADADINDLSDAEIEMVKQLLLWPIILERAALDKEPQQVVYYLTNLAKSFHSFWSIGKRDGDRIVSDNLIKTKNRVKVLSAIKTVIENGLGILGCQPVRLIWDD